MALPFLVAPVEATRSPIVEVASNLEGGSASLATLAPTAPNSPMRSQSGNLRRRSSSWSNESDLDFSSEEVQRALDEAEANAGARVWRPRSNHTPGTEDNEGSVISSGSIVSRTIDSRSNISAAMSSTTSGSYHHVTAEAVNQAPASPGAHHLRQMHSGTPPPQQPLSYVLPTCYMIVNSPPPAELISNHVFHTIGSPHGTPRTERLRTDHSQPSSGRRDDVQSTPSRSQRRARHGSRNERNAQ